MADSQQLQQFAVIKLEDNDIKAYRSNKKGEPDLDSPLITDSCNVIV